MSKKVSRVLMFIGIVGLLASMVALQWEGFGEDDDPVVVLGDDDSAEGSSE